MMIDVANQVWVFKGADVLLDRDGIIVHHYHFLFLLGSESLFGLALTVMI